MSRPLPCAPACAPTAAEFELCGPAYPTPAPIAIRPADDLVMADNVQHQIEALIEEQKRLRNEVESLRNQVESSQRQETFCIYPHELVSPRQTQNLQGDNGVHMKSKDEPVKIPAPHEAEEAEEEEDEHYELQSSIWDASVMVGMPDDGAMFSPVGIYVFVLICANIFMQVSSYLI